MATKVGEKPVPVVELLVPMEEGTPVPERPVVLVGMTVAMTPMNCHCSHPTLMND